MISIIINAICKCSKIREEIFFVCSTTTGTWFKTAFIRYGLYVYLFWCLWMCSLELKMKPNFAGNAVTAT